jgi:hypothetical protein
VKNDPLLAVAGTIADGTIAVTKQLANYQERALKGETGFIDAEPIGIQQVKPTFK